MVMFMASLYMLLSSVELCDYQNLAPAYRLATKKAYIHMEKMK